MKPAALFAALSAALSAAGPITGDWILEPAAQPGRLRLVLTRPGIFVDAHRLVYLSPTELQGLDPAAFQTPGAPVSLTLLRDAGTFRLTGTAEPGRLTGSFRFTENPVYVAALREVASNWWDPSSVYDLALRGVPLTFVRNVPAVERTPALSTSGLARRFENGLPPPSLAPLQGVTRGYFRALQESGYPLFPEDAIRLHTFGISPDLVRQWKLSGHDLFNANDLIRLQGHGITSHDIRTFELRTGRTNLSVDEIVKLKEAPQP